MSKIIDKNLSDKFLGRNREKKNIDFIPRLLKDNVRVHYASILGKYTTIGYGTNINGMAFIASCKEAPVTIGKYCAIAHNFRIRTRNHYTGYANLQDRFQRKYGLPSLDLIKGPVTVGNNVWIGDNVIILSGVTVGDGAVLGAGAIVTKDVPAYSIAVGNPAKSIKKRFSDAIIEQLIKIEWWNWSEDKIKRNLKFFETDLSYSDDLDLNKIIVD
jgi:virginiamycin A acetyltransferase